jgi:hypothetical protein
MKQNIVLIILPNLRSSKKTAFQLKFDLTTISHYSNINKLAAPGTFNIIENGP